MKTLWQRQLEIDAYDALPAQQFALTTALYETEDQVKIAELKKSLNLVNEKLTSLFTDESIEAQNQLKIKLATDLLAKETYVRENTPKLAVLTAKQLELIAQEKLLITQSANEASATAVITNELALITKQLQNANELDTPDLLIRQLKLKHDQTNPPEAIYDRLAETQQELTASRLALSTLKAEFDPARLEVAQHARLQGIKNSVPPSQEEIARIIKKGKETFSRFTTQERTASIAIKALEEFNEIAKITQEMQALRDAITRNATNKPAQTQELADLIFLLEVYQSKIATFNDLALPGARGFKKNEDFYHNNSPLLLAIIARLMANDSIAVETILRTQLISKKKIAIWDILTDKFGSIVDAARLSSDKTALEEQASQAQAILSGELIENPLKPNFFLRMARDPRVVEMLLLNTGEINTKIGAILPKFMEDFTRTKNDDITRSLAASITHTKKEAKAINVELAKLRSGLTPTFGNPSTPEAHALLILGHLATTLGSTPADKEIVAKQRDELHTALNAAPLSDNKSLQRRFNRLRIALAPFKIFTAEERAQATQTLELLQPLRLGNQGFLNETLTPFLQTTVASVVVQPTEVMDIVNLFLEWKISNDPLLPATLINKIAAQSKIFDSIEAQLPDLLVGYLTQYQQNLNDSLAVPLDKQVSILAIALEGDQQDEMLLQLSTQLKQNITITDCSPSYPLLVKALNDVEIEIVNSLLLMSGEELDTDQLAALSLEQKINILGRAVNNLDADREQQNTLLESINSILNPASITLDAFKPIPPAITVLIGNRSVEQLLTGPALLAYQQADPVRNALSTKLKYTELLLANEGRYIKETLMPEFTQLRANLTESGNLGETVVLVQPLLGLAVPDVISRLKEAREKSLKHTLDLGVTIGMSAISSAIALEGDDGNREATLASMNSKRTVLVADIKKNLTPLLATVFTALLKSKEAEITKIIVALRTKPLEIKLITDNLLLILADPALTPDIKLKLITGLKEITTHPGFTNLLPSILSNPAIATRLELLELPQGFVSTTATTLLPIAITSDVMSIIPLFLKWNSSKDTAAFGRLVTEISKQGLLFNEIIDKLPGLLTAYQQELTRKLAKSEVTDTKREKLTRNLRYAEKLLANDYITTTLQPNLRQLLTIYNADRSFLLDRIADKLTNLCVNDPLWRNAMDLDVNFDQTQLKAAILVNLKTAGNNATLEIYLNIWDTARLNLEKDHVTKKLLLICTADSEYIINLGLDDATDQNIRAKLDEYTDARMLSAYLDTLPPVNAAPLMTKLAPTKSFVNMLNFAEAGTLSKTAIFAYSMVKQVKAVTDADNLVAQITAVTQLATAIVKAETTTPTVIQGALQILVPLALGAGDAALRIDDSTVRSQNEIATSLEQREALSNSIKQNLIPALATILHEVMKTHMSEVASILQSLAPIIISEGLNEDEKQVMLKLMTDINNKEIVKNILKILADPTIDIALKKQLQAGLDDLAKQPGLKDMISLSLLQPNIAGKLTELGVNSSLVVAAVPIALDLSAELLAHVPEITALSNNYDTLKVTNEKINKIQKQLDQHETFDHQNNLVQNLIANNVPAKEAYEKFKHILEPDNQSTQAFAAIFGITVNPNFNRTPQALAKLLSKIDGELGDGSDLSGTHASKLAETKLKLTSSLTILQTAKASIMTQIHRDGNNIFDEKLLSTLKTKFFPFAANKINQASLTTVICKKITDQPLLKHVPKENIQELVSDLLGLGNELATHLINDVERVELNALLAGGIDVLSTGSKKNKLLFVAEIIKFGVKHPEINKIVTERLPSIITKHQNLLTTVFNNFIFGHPDGEQAKDKLHGSLLTTLTPLLIKHPDLLQELVEAQAAKSLFKTIWVGIKFCFRDFSIYRAAISIYNYRNSVNAGVNVIAEPLNAAIQTAINNHPENVELGALFDAQALTESDGLVRNALNRRELLNLDISAPLTKMKIDGFDFTGSRFNAGASFEGSQITQCNFEGVKFKPNVSFQNATMDVDSLLSLRAAQPDIDLSGVKITGEVSQETLDILILSDNLADIFKEVVFDAKSFVSLLPAICKLDLSGEKIKGNISALSKYDLSLIQTLAPKISLQNCTIDADALEKLLREIKAHNTKFPATPIHLEDVKITGTAIPPLHTMIKEGELASTIIKIDRLSAVVAQLGEKYEAQSPKVITTGVVVEGPVATPGVSSKGPDVSAIK